MGSVCWTKRQSDMRRAAKGRIAPTPATTRYVVLDSTHDSNSSCSTSSQPTFLHRNRTTSSPSRRFATSFPSPSLSHHFVPSPSSASFARARVIDVCLFAQAPLTTSHPPGQKLPSPPGIPVTTFAILLLISIPPLTAEYGAALYATRTFGFIQMPFS